MGEEKVRVERVEEMRAEEEGRGEEQRRGGCVER